MKQENIRKYVAEFIGTMILSIGVLATSMSNLGALLPLFAGFFLMVLVYSLGSISGGNFNPAVTVGLLATKKIEIKQALIYVVMQCLGAVVGFFIVMLLQGGKFSPFAGSTTLDLRVMIGELLGTFVFTLGIGSVVFGKVSEKLSGVVIGFSLMLGIMIASVGGAGALNPAVALGNNVLTISTVVGPLLGGVLGMIVAKVLYENKVLLKK
jgi:aquaporin Z